MSRVDQPSHAALPARVVRRPFGTTSEGTPVEEFVLTNGSGAEVRATNYGGIITALRVPDRYGHLADVVHGFDAIEPYLTRHPYFGALVGRCANRIAGARFTLDGRTHHLAVNHGPHHLHGGVQGFDRHVWRAQPVAGEAAVLFSRTSPGGEEGYPGQLTVQVRYTLREADELAIVYEATTDRATPVNLTQHTYFNLAGHDSGDILGHDLVVEADRYTPTDGDQIPTGEIAPVAGTPLDFRSATAIGARIDDPHPQLQHGRGYDHNFVLNRSGGGLERAARLTHAGSGRTLEVLTTEPGLQVYSGNRLDGSVRGKRGTLYGRRSGVCLETQHYPDAPNHQHFPSVILRPGETYHSETVFRFGQAG